MDPMEPVPSGEDRPVSIPFGIYNPLLKVTTGESVVSLLCGCRDEDVRPFKRGELTVAALRSPETETLAAMVVSLVGRHHWPLGKDSTVLRVRPRRFCFCLPGLLYGVTLPDGCTDDEMRRLEEILRTFCTYHDHAGEQDPERAFWASAYPNIMEIITAHPSPFRDAASTSDEEMVASAPPSSETPISGEELRRPYAMVLQRAMTFSAATKTVAKALLRGLITQNHIVIAGAPAASRPALASVRVVSDVVDAADATAHASVGSPVRVPYRRFPAEMERPFWTFVDWGLLFILPCEGPAASDLVFGREGEDAVH